MYAKRYGVSLQDVIFGKGFMPNDEIMVWTVLVTSWLEWYDYVKEGCSWYPDAHCPDHVKDSRTEFGSWLRAQKDKETQKLKTKQR